MGIPRSRCSTPALPPTSSLACTLCWHHVPLPPRVNLHTGTIGTPFLCLPLHPSCLHPLLPPRLRCHGPVPAASSSPLTSTWGFHVADAAHRGVTTPSVCPTPFNISNAYPIPAPSSHWGFHVADAARLPYHLLHLLPAPYTGTMTPSKPPHRDHRDSIPVSPTSCLHPLPPPRLHCHGPVPASSSPLTSTWGFHVADAAHRGVTMPSVCPTPFNISNAYPLPAPSSPRSRCSTPSCPLLTLGIPHSRSALPPTRHHAFCPPHTSFVSLPGVGGTGRQPLNLKKSLFDLLTTSEAIWGGTTPFTR